MQFIRKWTWLIQSYPQVAKSGCGLLIFVLCTHFNIAIIYHPQKYFSKVGMSEYCACEMVASLHVVDTRQMLHSYVIKVTIFFVGTSV